jgi:hypothetical protein
MYEESIEKLFANMDVKIHESPLGNFVEIELLDTNLVSPEGSHLATYISFKQIKQLAMILGTDEITVTGFNIGNPCLCEMDCPHYIPIVYVEAKDVDFKE